MAPQREWFEKDYYAALGVESGASEKEITRAYRRLAKQFHPDANPGDEAAEERFKEISAAYDVLGDTAKRREYDEARRLAASGFGPFTFGGADGVHTDFSDLGGLGGLGDLLGGMFGRGRQRGGRGAGGARPGADLEAELRLSFLEAIEGVTTTVRLTSDATCRTCHGTGAAAGSQARRCEACGGAGAVARNQGPFSFSEVCGRCGGSGQVIDKPCDACRGRGVETVPREVKVRVPAGVEEGTRIRVKGRGGPGALGGPAGDLYVVVHVAPHKIFGRRGRDLTVELPVTFAEAVLGADLRVPTLDGAVTMRIPPGTPSGKTLRVKGRGVAGPKGTGDLLVTVVVIVPSDLSAAEREAVEALAAATSRSPRAHLGV